MQSAFDYAILKELCKNENRESFFQSFLRNSNRLLRSGGMEMEDKAMREGIHPNYYQAKVVCNCGNEFVTGSTKEEIHVEICSKCHSFYTGQQKAVKARGAIDKFNRRYGIQAN